MPKAQMHFEVDPELKQHWKAYFALLPRSSETRVLTELMRNFLKSTIEANKFQEEPQNDPGKNEMDNIGNRAGVDDQSGVEVPGSTPGDRIEAVPGSQDLGSKT